MSIYVLNFYTKKCRFVKQLYNSSIFQLTKCSSLFTVETVPQKVAVTVYELINKSKLGRDQTITKIP